LFTLGTFLVIVFAFLPVIGEAANVRADAAVDKLIQERDAKIKRLLPKGKSATEATGEESRKFQEDERKIREEYEKQIADARDEAAATRTGNKRALWLERYGVMFGFLFLSFGCIGYLRTEQPLVLRVVAAVVLSAALILVFGSSLAGCGGGGATVRPPVS
jgi:hypothetical protein